MSFNDWDGGWAQGTRFTNNIFYVDGRVRYRFGQSKGNVFERNVYFGRHEGRPGDEAAGHGKARIGRAGNGGGGVRIAGGDIGGAGGRGRRWKG